MKEIDKGKISISFMSVCQGKEKFDSYAVAQRAIRRPEKKGYSSVITPYKCKFCGGWHIGNNYMKGKK